MTLDIQDDPVWKQIDTASYIYLRRLFEPRDNALSIVLDEAISNTAKSGPIVLPGGISMSGNASPIESTADCRVFTLHWKNYVSYCVTEEMHGSCGQYDDEEYTGRLVRVYARSHFLDFVGKDTGAHSESYQHYKICCLHHVIDVVAVSLPELESFSRDEAEFAAESKARWQQ